MTRTQPQGYLAIPRTGKGSCVLVLHAWWGLNDTIKAFCDRSAKAGFVVFAPDLYHGQVADTIPGAEALVKALNANHHRPNLRSRRRPAFSTNVLDQLITVWL